MAPPPALAPLGQSPPMPPAVGAPLHPQAVQQQQQQQQQQQADSVLPGSQQDFVPLFGVSLPAMSLGGPKIDWSMPSGVQHQPHTSGSGLFAGSLTSSIDGEGDHQSLLNGLHSQMQTRGGQVRSCCMIALILCFWLVWRVTESWLAIDVEDVVVLMISVYILYIHLQVLMASPPMSQLGSLSSSMDGGTGTGTKIHRPVADADGIDDLLGMQPWLE
jgi:hypothetical protein